MSAGEPDLRASNNLSGAWASLAPVLGVLVTGVGLLAFVALFGGAILWDRTSNAGLPGTESVALIPRSTLLATGAHFLVGALILSLVALGALWLVDTSLRTPQEIAAAAEAATTDFVDRYWMDEEGAVAEPRQHGSEEHEALARAIDAASRAQGLAIEKEAELASARTNETSDDEVLEAMANALRRTKEQAEQAQRELERAKERLTLAIVQHEEQRAFLARALTLGLLLIVGEVLLLLFHPWLGMVRYGSLVVAGIGTAVLAFAVYRATHSFAWFAVAAFLAVATFQGLATHFAITAAPQVEPAAVLINKQPPITGIFVAESADRVYLGVRVADSKTRGLVALDREQVRGLAVGSLTNADEADGVAAKLVDLLCAELPAPTTAKERKSLPQCATVLS